SLRLSPDGHFLAVCNHHSELSVYETPDLRPVFVKHRINSVSPWIDISPDSKLIAVGGGNEAGRLPGWRLLRLPDGNAVHLESTPPSWCDAGAFSPDGKYLALAFYEGTVEIWDVAQIRKLASWRAHPRDPNDTANIRAVAFSPGGKLLAT